MNKFFVFIFAISMLTASSCRYHGRRIRGNGREITEQRSIAGFTAVDAQGSINIIVSNGDYKVSVKGDENLMQYVVTEVVNSRLLVHLRTSVSFIEFGELTVYVSAPVINDFESHGSGNVNGEGKLTDKDKIQVKIFGSGNISLDIDAPAIESEIHGSGNAMLSGETRDLSCALHSSGDLEAGNLKAENVQISVHGSGNADVFASELLNAELTASGDVHYKGEPKITSTIHGSGELSKME